MKRPLSAQVDLARARELYAAGQHLREIAPVVGCSMSYLHRLLVLEGKWKARQGADSTRVTPDEYERIYALLRKGYTLERAGAECGRSINTSRKVAKHYGFKPPQCRSAAPGRRTVLYVGEGRNMVPQRVWCAVHGDYVPVADAVKSPRTRTGFASICAPCNRAKTKACTARRKTASASPH